METTNPVFFTRELCIVPHKTLQGKKFCPESQCVGLGDAIKSIPLLSNPMETPSGGSHCSKHP